MRKWKRKNHNNQGNGAKSNEYKYKETNINKTRVNTSGFKKETVIVKEKNGSWLGWITERLPFYHKESVKIPVKADKMKSWFSFSRSSDKQQTEEKPAEKSNKNTEVTLMRQMCGEFREVIKGQNAAEREERQKELVKVRGAR